jgi:hypothetical protein
MCKEVVMNVTLSADAKLIEKARRAARARGATLNGLIRQYMQQLVGEKSREQTAEEFAAFMRRHAGCSRPGYRFNRDEIHDR